MKYALITGGSRGIGAAAARLFARRGWGVAVNYNRSEAQAEALARELSGLGVPAGRCARTWPIPPRWRAWLTMC